MCPKYEQHIERRRPKRLTGKTWDSSPGKNDAVVQPVTGFFKSMLILHFPARNFHPSKISFGRNIVQNRHNLS